MRLAGYTVLGRLGSGSSGTVWKAHDDRLGRIVAIKALDAPSQQSRAQWRSEAAVLAALDDPHLVAVYGYAEDAEGAYIVEEWIDGAPLSAVLNNGPLSTAQALGVIRGALLGLAHVHARGLVHGDIAPGNILLDMQGTSKLVDFGLSTSAGTPSTSSGTAAYASPEAQRGQVVTAPSDVYAAAAVLAYLLRGRAAQQPVLDGIDPALAPVLARALDPDAGRRYPDAAAFLAALEHDATRRYGSAWWTQAGVAALVAGAPAVLLIQGTGSAGAAAGHGSTAAAGPAPAGAGHSLAPVHQAGLSAPPPGQAMPQWSQPVPTHAPPEQAASRNLARARPRARIYLAATSAVVAATVAVVAYAATRPSHHTTKPSAIAGASSIGATTPSVATSLPTSPPASTTSASSVAGSIAGKWAGTYTSAGFGVTGSFSVVFAVQGNAVTDKITIVSGCIQDGTISGALNSGSLSFGKVKSANDVGAVSFQGTVNGDTMSGRYTSDVSCGSDSGTWQATRG
ncbi:MAG: serine/threonine-protein kinase [Pseudonocardiales bacterium]